ncbi:two-component system, chemotaxis family, response regulator CheV [Thermosulfidibacter takaii ABI70S6]|uniref:Two-component system, chemotaxis family, response regulator CheV n=1 Tax=Thermosulfidibacter takaii (strain DSM 17441 / JCM 13301 / NBRC 103674 / ABI70S6) TaxID=1298851 RepID=A0A0S3QTG5_THET7|nr:chemotaxis protein [Thermosulfidibacter takaii]BAT71627.1 two-component system, chemotaxis family, response regulator CheV [Thermosulfidibacter takaii ABI70S6]
MAWKPESVPDVLQPGTNEFELVEFWMYDERENGEIYPYIFGVNVAKVKEVVWLPEIIKVPNLPDAIVGVINLRGEVIPLIDLAKWMQIREPSHLKRKSVIVTEFYKVKIGFIVHEAKRIRRVGWDKIKPAPEVLVAQFGTKVTGVIEIEGDRFLLILDLENVLAELGLISMPEEIKVEEIPEDVKGPVLLADDSAVARKILKEIYTKAGFTELLIAKNGREAWDMLVATLEKANQEGKDILDYISLVVTDVEMPQMDGYTLARKIKSHPQLAKVPVIINTSLSEESNIDKAEQVHADAFFVKFEPEELIKVSKELIHKARKGTLSGEILTNIDQHSQILESSFGREEDMKAEPLNNPLEKAENDDVAKKKDEQVDEIDKILAQFGIGDSNHSPIEIEGNKTEELKEHEAEQLQEDNKRDEGKQDIDDIDALISEFQTKQQEEANVHNGLPEDSNHVTDIVDQILMELESGKMGSSELDTEGSYEVPTAEKLLEREDLEEVIKKLEDKIKTLSEGDDSLKTELISLVDALKSHVKGRTGDSTETRVVEKLYRVTRETEEKTYKLMDILDEAMNKTIECIQLAESLEASDLKEELVKKLNEINDTLFEAMNHLQFQDITRQKIERVIVALKKLNDYLNEWFGTDFIGDADGS